jgi:hypothetical protein
VDRAIRRKNVGGGDPSRVGLAQVWREALTAFAAWPAPILLCAAAGFAAPGVLALALHVPPLEVLVRGQVAYYAFRALRGGPPWVWGGVALVAQVFAHGTITALAWCEARDAGGVGSLVAPLRAACRCVAARLPALALGWLAYVLLMAVAAAGMSGLLTALRLDPVQLWADLERQSLFYHPVDLPEALLGREVAAHAVNTVLPDPGPLACGVAAAVRAGVFRSAPDPAGPTWSPTGTYRPPAVLLLQADAVWLWPVVLGSLALLLGAETLLRFRTAAALVGSPGGARQNPWAAWSGAGVAWRRLGAVMLYGGLLRCVTVGVQLLFIAVPTLLVERLAIPWVAQAVGAPWVVPACVLGVATGVALVNGVLSAFAVVYDARLFAALQRAERGR